MWYKLTVDTFYNDPQSLNRSVQNHRWLVHIILHIDLAPFNFKLDPLPFMYQDACREFLLNVFPCSKAAYLISIDCNIDVDVIDCRGHEDHGGICCSGKSGTPTVIGLGNQLTSSATLRQITHPSGRGWPITLIFFFVRKKIFFLVVVAMNPV